jgi:hypothetical protein
VIRKTPFAFATSLSAFFDLTDLVQAVIVGPPSHGGAPQGILDQPLPARLLIPVTDAEALPQGHPAAGKPATRPGDVRLPRPDVLAAGDRAGRGLREALHADAQSR